MSTIKIHKFTWNPVRENAYVVYDASDENRECLIIDPGCYEAAEQNELSAFIKSEHLKPVKLLNTHCHFDHVFGNKFVFDQYGLAPFMHRLELPVLESIPSYAPAMGFRYEFSPSPAGFLEEGDRISVGRDSLEVLFTPGHSPGSISFYFPTAKALISGDVLFFESIGRTDLPGGNLEILEKSIRNKLYTLDELTVVYAGHGWETTIGHEKKLNPFVKA